MRRCVINSRCSLLGTVYPHVWILMKPFLLQNANECWKLIYDISFRQKHSRNRGHKFMFTSFSICYPFVGMLIFLAKKASFAYNNTVKYPEAKLYCDCLVSATWKNFWMLNSMRHKHILGIPKSESPNSTNRKNKFDSFSISCRCGEADLRKRNAALLELSLGGKI